jgi:tRNA-modifying protein YgfZ
MSGLVEQYREFRTRGGIIDLASRLKLLFTGTDRVRYINGQVTANIAKAKIPSVTPACVTTVKGKLSAEIRVSVGPSGILVDADGSLAESLPGRLERYIIADDVAMENVSESIAIVHLLGMKEDSIPETIRGQMVASNRYGIAGWDYFPPFRKDLPPVWAQLSAVFPVLSEELLEVIRIEQGVPRWGFELEADTLPAEAGLDRTHIDFHKGCYIGQEVISRIKSVGHVNRELQGFVAEDGSALTAGARIFTAEQPEKDLGRLTSTTLSLALDRPVALGYLRRGAPIDGLLAASAEAPDAPVRVALHSLPFVS